jgi:CelD/BcsL family acetyltransferase involved in cellulose biosynthesis
VVGAVDGDKQPARGRPPAAGSLGARRARQSGLSAPAGERQRLAFSTVAAEAVGVISAQWAELAERAPGDNVFFHPDFAIPAMRYLGRGDVAVATASTPTGELRGLALFNRTRLGRVAPAAKLWSHHYGPMGLPLIAPEVAEEAVAALVDGLAPPTTAASLIVPDLPLDGPVAGALFKVAKQARRPVAVLEPYVRAVLRRPADGAFDLRPMLSAGRRKEYGRLLRRLGELGRVTVEVEASPERVRAAFEEFVQLEGGGWKGRRGTALASSAGSSQFAREVVARRADAGAVRIVSLRVDRRPIAAVVCLIAGDTAFTWKIAYDESFSRFSPGAQLMIEAGSRLFADAAVRVIDSCAVADHPMIDPLWHGRRPIGTLAIGPPGGGALYGAAVAAARLEVAVLNKARQWRDRLPRPLNRLLRDLRPE